MKTISEPIPPELRGAIFEEIVLYLLKLVGYRVIEAGADGTQKGAAGLMVRGRGEWHQIDALAAFDKTPAFMYPLRLMVEAKCNRKNRAGIEIVRNTVGVLKDISENFFTYQPSDGSEDQSVQVARYNYHAAIFSTTGYTRNAQRYALAHQIFLIQYNKIHLLEPVIDSLMALRLSHFQNDSKSILKKMPEIREAIRQLLAEKENTGQNYRFEKVFTGSGLSFVKERLIGPVTLIKGSYFGMLQGKWPLHLLSKSPLPSEAFKNSDQIKCKVHSSDLSRWYFSPSEIAEGNSSWFKLGFDIPEETAFLVKQDRNNAIRIANLKRQKFSFLDISGKIGGLQRQVRLTLDDGWLDRYLESLNVKQ